MLDKALELLTDSGPSALSMSGLAKALGAPSGSVYHRFQSRDRLMASLWLGAVEEFQEVVLSQLGDPPDRAQAMMAIQAALDWTRAHTGKAQLLLLYRRRDLISGEWPADIAERAKGLSEELEQAMVRLARALELELERVVFAVSELFIAAVRGHLVKGQAPPKSRDTLVLEAAAALLKATDSE